MKFKIFVFWNTNENYIKFDKFYFLVRIFLLITNTIEQVGSLRATATYFVFSKRSK